MNKKNILGIIGVIIVAVASIAAFKNGGISRVAKNGGIYCSSDGTLTDKMPIQSHRSYCLKSDSTDKAYSTSTPSEYSFSLVDDQGNTLKDFQVTHTQLMHVIVVRKDLAYFQHLHANFDPATGIFTLDNLTFPADGTYRIFADFAPANAQMDTMGMPLAVTSFEDVSVGIGSKYTPQPIGSEATTKTFNGYQVTLSTSKSLESGAESMLTFTLEQNGKPITDLETYLGALGHSVILREGNLDFIHAHPTEDPSQLQNGKVDFMVDFPEGGTYKVFTQFQKAGKVFTTDFVITVAQGSNPTDSMPGMDMQSMPGMKMN